MTTRQATIATRFQLRSEFDAREIHCITIDRMNSPFYEGEKWAVRRGASVLAKDGEWEYEPMPSNRDDDFYARCRFDSFNEALNAACPQTDDSTTVKTSNQK